MIERYPKLLVVVPESIGGNSASSFTLTNLLAGWPKERVSIITYKIPAGGFDQVHSHWLVRFPLLVGDPQKQNTRMARSSVDSIHGCRKKIQFLLNNRYLKNLTVNLLDLLPIPRLSSSFVRWLEQEYKPDLIYSWLGGVQSTRLVKQLSLRLQTSVVPHFMDDWLFLAQSAPVLKRVRSMIIKREFLTMLPVISRGIGISPDMAKVYQKRLGIPMDYVANGVEGTLLAKLRSRSYKPRSKVLNLCIIGRLDYGRDEVLEEVLKNLSHHGLSSCVRIHVYSNSDLTRIDRYDNVYSHRPPQDSTLLELKKTIDCMLYVDSFSLEQISYFRYSFSAKIPLYLAMGVPILTVGPQEVYSVKYLDSCEVGPTIPSIDQTGRAVRGLLDATQQQLEGWGNRATDIANRHHTIETQRARFRSILGVR